MAAIADNQHTQKDDRKNVQVIVQRKRNSVCVCVRRVYVLFVSVGCVSDENHQNVFWGLSVHMAKETAFVHVSALVRICVSFHYKPDRNNNYVLGLTIPPPSLL